MKQSLTWTFSSPKYFLTDGKPDKTKQKDALILHGLMYHNAEKIAPIVKSIPGLAIHITRYITLVEWEGTLAGALDAAFAKLKSFSIDWSCRVPTEEAGFDLNRFMEKYFLRLGAPDPAKTKELLEITCRPEFEDCLLVAVKAVLGLHHRYGTPYASDQVMFIGWDPEKVNKKVRTIEKERARKIAQIAAEEQTEEEEQRVAIFKPHTDFMRNFTTTPGTLTLDDFKGSFLAHSLEIEDYTDDYDGLNLYIQLPSSPQSHGVVAEFHFGVVKGTTTLLSLR